MSGFRRSRHRTATQIFAVPALIAILCGAGLVSALVGDGIWDGVSWILLSLPILILAVCVGVARGANGTQRSGEP